jgi:hypothetical protein
LTLDPPVSAFQLVEIIDMHHMSGPMFFLNQLQLGLPEIKFSWWIKRSFFCFAHFFILLNLSIVTSNIEYFTKIVTVV